MDRTRIDSRKTTRRPARLSPAPAAALAGLLLLLMGLTPAAVAANFPLSVTDDLGREIVLESAPQRVVAMMPSHTETVCALQACELLVGVDQFSNHPAEVEALPRLGSAFAANVEEIVALEPDLVLVDEDSGIAGQLAELGMVVYAGTPQSFDELFDDFATLGRLLDRQEEAAELIARVRAEVEQVARAVAGEERPTVFFELDATPYSVGPGSYIDQLIDLAGGQNIVGEGFDSFPQVDPEFVVAADPEVIVLSDAPFGETAATVAARPGWGNLAAVTAGRVVELTEEQADAMSRPGPRVSEAVRHLAAIFHPALF